MNPFESKKIARVAMLGSLMIFSAGFSAQAGTVADWNFTDAETCSVSTNNTNFGGGDNFPSNESNIYITISKAKNKPEIPVEIMVQFVTNVNKSSGAMASISGAGSLALADLDGRKMFFWGVPKNLANFIEQLKSGRSNLAVKGVGGRRSEDLKLSTRGFKDVLSQMESACNSGKSLVNADFDTAFMASVPDSIDPTRIDATKATQLRSIYYAAYRASFSISNAAADLAKLLAKYQPYMDELAQNRAELNQIQDVELPNTRNTLAAAQKQQAEAVAEIASIDNAIPGLNAKIAASQKAHDAARAILAPLEPEYNRITGQLNNAQSTLSEAQNRLSYIETRLRDGAQQISNLDFEATNIERRLPQKRSDLDRARSIFRDAQSRRANFNVSWERDSRLRNHFEYSRLHNDRQHMSNQLRQNESDLQRVRFERDRVARELQMCRANPIIAVESTKEFLVPGQPGNPGAGGGLVPGPRPPPGGGGGGGLVPGPPGGGNPGGPGNPPVQPPRDCSHLEHALNNANAQVSQREQENRMLSNRLNEIGSRINQIERQVDMEVRREYDSLVYAEDQARRENDRLEADVQNDQNRLSQIRSSDIPRLEREQTQLQNERPSVISRISQATSDVSRLSQELSSFKSANDWDRKAGSVASTGNQLSSDQQNLKQAQSNKAAAQRRLEAGAVTEAQSIAKIDSLNARVVALNNRAVALDKILENLPAERADFDATLAAQRVELESRRVQFLDLLK